MFEWLASVRLDQPGILWGSAAVAVLLAIVLMTRRGSLRGRVVQLGALVLGAGLALLLCWVLGDVLDVFGIELTPTTRWWAAVAFGGAALALASLIRARPWRIVVAVVTIPVFLLVGAVGINQDFGEFRTVGDALGISPYGAFQPLAQAQGSTSDWKAPAGMPAEGRVERIDIPATHSHFSHREALVYLPPAALSADPPALPVVEALSGQPGQPSDLFASAGIGGVLNRFAAAHHGIAPIVVVPDQLGAPDRNPMCVDGPLGNSASYLTEDVPDWITTHLPVSTSRNDWFIAGFSEGGTCAIQLGAAHPDLYGGLLDISGEVVPSVGADTVQLGFSGDAAAYTAAQPLTILAAHTPYPDSVAIFGYGSADTRYGPGVRTIEAAAAAAGMRTSTFVSDGTAHDWHTVHAVFTRALPVMAARLGLA